MSIPIFRYPVDLTGVNFNNLIADEEHTLVNLPNRAVIPMYAPYFTESVVVRDHITNALLVKGEQYQCLQLVEEATIKSGKEVCEVILITDPAVSNHVRITYQTIGGLYQRTSDAILAMYNTVINDNRPVDWSNVLNKPYNYPPSLHRHLFKDLVGFEPLIVELERLRNAIILSDVPAFEALIDWFSNRVPKEVIMIKPSRFRVPRGASVTINLESVNIVDPYNYYWTIEHLSTTNNDFVANSGIVNLKTGFNNFRLLTKIPLIDAAAQEFKINIRKNSTTGQIIYTSGVVTLVAHNAPSYLDALFGCACLYNPELAVDPETYFVADRQSC
jgi:hypothetical protein